ncbi:MAG: sigma-70 family RNA polymerase sigma factor, partial [Betaproteobacteria bacterium]
MKPESIDFDKAAADRDALVGRHTDLVRQIALKLKRRVPQHVDLNDLMQSGIVGLLEAAQRYDGSGRSTFATFASYRIRGAMVDLLRKSDMMSRSNRRRLRSVDSAQADLQSASLGKAPPALVAKAMGISVDAYHRLI